MSLVKMARIAAAAFAAMAAQPAFASTLAIGGGVTSAPSLGVTGGTAGSLSETSASLYDFTPSDAVNEAKALNILAGTNFTSGVQTDMGGASSATFSTAASWIALKIGNSHFFLQNTAGPVTLFINFLKASGPAGAGAGLSHITEFGNEVPIPGALWLMGAGIAGLGFARRKKKA